MKKHSKKGFTLVELVIVIAVIAILSAVLIPTFGNVVADANRAAALANVNTVINNYAVKQAEKGGGSELGEGYIIVFDKTMEFYGTSIDQKTGNLQVTSDTAFDDPLTAENIDSKYSYTFYYKDGKVSFVEESVDHIVDKISYSVLKNNAYSITNEVSGAATINIGTNDFTITNAVILDYSFDAGNTSITGSMILLFKK